MNRVCTSIGLLLSIVSAGGCVANKAYRTCLDQPQNRPCSMRSVLNEQLTAAEFDRTQTGAQNVAFPYTISFVEFDDRGEMFDRAQLAAAVDTINKAKASAPAGTHPVVAVFVHGWKNNASDSSGNVWGFRQTLAALSLQYKVPGGPFSPVVGVYIGWRGAVVSAPILKEFTFFDRHSKSQNLPGPHMAEALVKIMQAAKGPDFSDDRTTSVLIGHSFGGAVLETALSETLADAVVAARAAQRPIQWPANLIMFLNEAQEATRSYQLIESLIANVRPRDECLPPGQSQRMQMPAIVSVSSTGDTATRLAFPAAQALNRPFNSLRHYPDGGNAVGIKSQTSMFFRTTAHMSEFQSHLVGRADDPDIAAALTTCKPALEVTMPSDQNNAAVRYLLIEKPGSRNRTPYWVFHIPPDIVPDHSTIFTPVFRSFLIALIGSQQLMSPHNQPLPPE